MSVGQINLIRYAVREATREAVREMRDVSFLAYALYRASYHPSGNRPMRTA